MGSKRIEIAFLLVLVMVISVVAEDWTQFKFDNRHSGNVPDRSVNTPLRLVAAFPFTDAVFTASIVVDGRVYVVDGSDMAFCLDASTQHLIWKFASEGGKANCNNVSSPAIAGNYLHFGTMAGNYYVLNSATGEVVRKIKCGEPIFSAPVVVDDRVYFATLGSRVYSLKPDGTINREYDFVKEHLGFTGNRWSGEDWMAYKKGRVFWQDQFLCSRDLVADKDMIILPAGSMVAWIKDAGNYAVSQAVHQLKRRATFGLTLDTDGTLYWQWVQKDNTGRVDKLVLHGGVVESSPIRGTEAGRMRYSLESFCSISLRGQDVYRCYLEENLGLCKHIPGLAKPMYLGGYPFDLPERCFEFKIVSGKARLISGKDAEKYVSVYPALKCYPITLQVEPEVGEFLSKVKYRILTK